MKQMGYRSQLPIFGFYADDLLLSIHNILYPVQSPRCQATLRITSNRWIFNGLSWNMRDLLTHERTTERKHTKWWSKHLVQYIKSHYLFESAYLSISFQLAKQWPADLLLIHFPQLDFCLKWPSKSLQKFNCLWGSFRLSNQDEIFRPWRQSIG